MAFCDRATVDAAESQCRDGSIGEAALGQGLERCFTPAVAAQAVQLQRVVAGEHLFLRGDAADGLYAVLDGCLRISGVTEAGKEGILSFVDSPNWLGEIAVSRPSN